ncbi:UNVERIFIED_CONTAM: penicillin-binding protein, partial [Prevotella sp. 15_C9]
ESIFLASIVPKPKHFKNSFTADGRLQESQEGYFRLIAERLAKKEVITDAQAAQVNINNVVLKGVAKSSFVSESWQ